MEDGLVKYACSTCYGQFILGEETEKKANGAITCLYCGSVLSVYVPWAEVKNLDLGCIDILAHSREKTNYSWWRSSLMIRKSDKNI